MSWETRTIHFPPVGRTFRKSVKCTGCGKRLQRQRRIEQTLNPWNTNTDGTVKTREDILAEVKADGTAWESQPETCSACQETAAAEEAAR